MPFPESASFRNTTWDDIAKCKDAGYIRESLIDLQAAIAEGYPA